MLGDRASEEYRIGEGGLLRRFEIATHLTHLHRQVAALLALTWLPLVILGLQAGRPHALVYDPAVHVRLLVAAPALLILDHVFPRVCRYTLAQLTDKAFVPEAARPRFERWVRGARRLADSSVPEIVIALACWSVSVAALAGAIPSTGFLRGAGLAPDRVWHVLSDLPVFQFLLWRSFWRWMIWVGILFGISRIDLDLVPTHPDRRGGIRFLALPSVGYCATLLFVFASVLCAEWGSLRTLEATLASFKPLVSVFAAAGMLIAFGPLLLFTPQLYRARHRGLLEMSSIAVDCGRRLRAAMNDPGSAVRDQDIVVLAGAEQAYRETVKQLDLLLFDKRDLTILLIATLLPVLAVMLTHIPRDEWPDLASLIVGWAP